MKMPAGLRCATADSIENQAKRKYVRKERKLGVDIAGFQMFVGPDVAQCPYVDRTVHRAQSPVEGRVSKQDSWDCVFVDAWEDQRNISSVVSS